MIARVALVLCRLAVDAHPSDGAMTTISQSALRGCVCLLLCNRSSFVFRLPPYKLRGERMTTISWNSSSFTSW
jgi:hypothetical protein